MFTRHFLFVRLFVRPSLAITKQQAFSHRFWYTMNFYSVYVFFSYLENFDFITSHSGRKVKKEKEAEMAVAPTQIFAKFDHLQIRTNNKKAGDRKWLQIS